MVGEPGQTSKGGGGGGTPGRGWVARPSKNPYTSNPHLTSQTTDQKMKEEEERRGNDTSSQYSTSTVGRTMQRMSSGISPPQRMRGASTEDASRRPSKIAASIALELEGNLSGEIILGSAGRRGQEKRRFIAREKSAKALRNGKATKEVSERTSEERSDELGIRQLHALRIKITLY